MWRIATFTGMVRPMRAAVRGKVESVTHPAWGRAVGQLASSGACSARAPAKKRARPPQRVSPPSVYVTSAAAQTPATASESAPCRAHADGDFEAEAYAPLQCRFRRRRPRSDKFPRCRQRFQVHEARRMPGDRIWSKTDRACTEPRWAPFYVNSRCLADGLW